MVALVIIAVLSALAVSYAGEDRANLRGFSEQIVGEADSARLRALSSRRWHRITFDVEARRMRVWQGDVVGMELPDDDEWTETNRVEIPRAMFVHAIATTANVVAGEAIPDDGDGLGEALLFGPDGAGAARTVYLRSKDRSLRHRVVIYRATGTAIAKEAW
jgi:Tfp pilus assembly protein FimT